MKVRIAMLLAAMAAFTIVSCEHDEIRVEMIPRDTGMYRQLIVYSTTEQPPQSMPVPTAWQLEKAATEVEVTGDIVIPAPPTAKRASAGLLAQICPFYSASCPAQGNENVVIFRGMFKEKLPADVGNGGTYAIYDSTLGNVYFYVETFRGEMDLAKAQQRRFAAVDRVVDLLRGYLASQLGRESNFAAVDKFMDTQVRQDMRNLSMHLAMRQGSDQNTGGVGELLLLLYQYAAQRGYLNPQDVPALVELLEKGPPPAAIREKFGSLLKISADSPKLAFLASSEQAGEAMRAYLASLPEYKARLSQWKQSQAAAQSGQSASAPAEPTPFVLLEEPLSVLQQDLTPPQADYLTVSLAPPQRPFQTNGQWSQDGSRVVWRKQLPARDYQTAYPIECEATWAAADVPFQRVHFGSTLLDNEDLFNYVMWRRALDKRDGQAWDGMLEKIEPANAFDKVAAFKFPSQNNAASAPSYIEQGRQAVLKKLQNAPVPAF